MIDYLNLTHSEAYYTSLGFERIETPWMVSEYVDNLTKPSDVKPFIVEINKKHLVASGEQSLKMGDEDLYTHIKKIESFILP